MSLRFGLVSHQRLLRELLRDHLVRTLRAEEVIEYGSVNEAMHALPRLRTLDLLVIDPDAMRSDPWQVLRRLARRIPRLKLALLTDTSGAYFAAGVAELGLRGIFHKRDALAELRAAVEAVLAGGIWQSAKIDQIGRGEFLRVLSPREIDILQQVASGQSNAAIARRLRLSPATIVTHRKNGMRKLGIRSSQELLVFAWRTGLVSTDLMAAATRVSSQIRR